MVTEGEVIDFLADDCDLSACIITMGKDSVTGGPTGNAYCAFENEDDATDALGATGRRLHGVTIQVMEVPQNFLELNLLKEEDKVDKLSKQPVVYQNAIRLSLFSGDASPKGGEVPFEVWKNEVKCLQNEEGCNPRPFPASFAASSIERHHNSSFTWM